MTHNQRAGADSSPPAYLVTPSWCPEYGPQQAAILSREIIWAASGCLSFYQCLIPSYWDPLPFFLWRRFRLGSLAGTPWTRVWKFFTFYFYPIRSQWMQPMDAARAAGRLGPGSPCWRSRVGTREALQPDPAPGSHSGVWPSLWKCWVVGVWKLLGCCNIFVVNCCSPMGK